MMPNTGHSAATSTPSATSDCTTRSPDHVMPRKRAGSPPSRLGVRVEAALPYRFSRTASVKERRQGVGEGGAPPGRPRRQLNPPHARRAVEREQQNGEQMIQSEQSPSG